MRELGVKTYSAAVNLALAEALRRRRAMALRQYFGGGYWEGDLSAMREDNTPPAHPSRRKPRGRS